ncbi:Rep protein [Rhodococcus sp. USK13]|uniref:Rep protein n=1 Tax=Rhodococcus sp. USK13 TaxID=2806442 RepID=UPI002016EC6C|nr:Rep protein [Rhodococcus sp. USK13]
MSPDSGDANVPQSPEVDAWAASVEAAARAVDELHEFNRETGQRGRSFALPVEPGREACVPVWSGRTEWLRQLRHQITHSDTGRTSVSKHKVGVERMMAVATAHAHFAESKTGRGITASRELIAKYAGVSETTVNRGRRVLRDLGMGVELARGRNLNGREFMAAELHHGGRQHRAASVWALSSPREVVAATPPAPQSKRKKRTRAAERLTNYRARLARHATKTAKAGSENPQIRGRDTLSLSSYFSSEDLLLRSTHQRARAGEDSSNPAHQEHQRSIELQKAAASLVANAPALNPRGHIGAICDALVASGIDITRWTGRDIARELGRDTAARGWIWPNSVDSPAAFLRWRLARMDWKKASPSELRALVDAERRREQAARAAEREHRDVQAASAEHRAAALAAVRQVLRDNRRRAEQ